MVTINRVSATMLDAKQQRPRPLSPREVKRQALERTLARAIKGAAQDGGMVAYRLVLEPEDKPSTVRGLSCLQIMPLTVA